MSATLEVFVYEPPLPATDKVSVPSLMLNRLSVEIALAPSFEEGQVTVSSPFVTYMFVALMPEQYDGSPSVTTAAPEAVIVVFPPAI